MSNANKLWESNEPLQQPLVLETEEHAISYDNIVQNPDTNNLSRSN
jgi:hypothetical protein